MEKKIVHTIVLKEPVSLGEETISELKFVKAKAKHFKGFKLDNMDFPSFLKIAANLCGQTDTCMDELSPSDAFEVVTYVGKLLVPTHPTGNIVSS